MAKSGVPSQGGVQCTLQRVQAIVEGSRLATGQTEVVQVMRLPQNQGRQSLNVREKSILEIITHLGNTHIIVSLASVTGRQTHPCVLIIPWNFVIWIITSPTCSVDDVIVQ